MAPTWAMTGTRPANLVEHDLHYGAPFVRAHRSELAGGAARHQAMGAC
jgi:hypothetical protein